MRLARILSLAGLVLAASGCGSGVLLRVASVEGDPLLRSGRTVSAPTQGLTPVGSVKFFFYPFANDSLIHPIPEREFLSDSSGRAEYFESASPFGNKVGALVAMKSGFHLDTVFFHYQADDTVVVLVNMRRR